MSSQSRVERTGHCGVYASTPGLFRTSLAASDWLSLFSSSVNPKGAQTLSPNRIHEQDIVVVDSRSFDDFARLPLPYSLIIGVDAMLPPQ